MIKTALVIGATGLVGHEIMNQLLSDPSVETVKIFTRRPTGPHTGANAKKIQEFVVDFDRINDWKDQIRGDALFSALGTTLKAAGSKEAQWKVDYTYQLNVAKVAAENGVPTMTLISSVSANPSSKIFYLRMKGELERKIQGLGFRCVNILRPASLTGPRQNQRLGEVVSVAILSPLAKFLRNYEFRPIPGSRVAYGAIQAAMHNKSGINFIEPKGLWS